jgi:Uncharacterised nucleotidyltransferase
MRHTKQVFDLIEKLVAVAISPAAGERQSFDFSPAAWKDSFEVLRNHKALAVVGGAVLARGLGEAVPAAELRRLRATHERAARFNMFRMAVCAAFFDALRPQEVAPVLLKSTALLAMQYPELAGHEMDDIDLYVEEREFEVARGVLEGLCFQLILDEPDGSTFRLAPMMLVDLHFRLRLFGDASIARLAMGIRSGFPGLGEVLVLEPHAMLVHLVYHFFDHRSSGGLRLSRLIDIGRVLRHWGPEIDSGRVTELLPSPWSLCWLLRCVRYFEGMPGIEIPRQLSQTASGADPLTVAEVLRDRELAVWGFPSPRGLSRVLACAVGIRRRGHRHFPRRYPQGETYFHWLVDQFHERRSFWRTPNLTFRRSIV